jgi:hypothetical protein
MTVITVSSVLYRCWFFLIPNRFGLVVSLFDFWEAGSPQSKSLHILFMYARVTKTTSKGPSAMNLCHGSKTCTFWGACQRAPADQNPTIEQVIAPRMRQVTQPSSQLVHSGSIINRGFEASLLIREIDLDLYLLAPSIPISLMLGFVVGAKSHLEIGK